MSDFCKFTFRTAKKAHICCECSGAILPGEWYQHCVSVADGSAASFKTCGDCAELRDTLIAECGLYEDEAPEFGGLHEIASEYPDSRSKFLEIRGRRLLAKA